MAKKRDQGVPVLFVAAAVFVLVTAMGWGMLAGSYAGATGTTPEIVSSNQPDEANMPRGRTAVRWSIITGIFKAVITFVSNAFVQLPNMLAVLAWHFSNRIWLPVLILILQLGVIAGGFGMHQMEQTLWEKPKAKRRKIPTPKVVDYD